MKTCRECKQEFEPNQPTHIQVLYRALEYACRELSESLPNKPRAREPEAWITYSVAVLKDEMRTNGKLSGVVAGMYP